MLDHSYRVLDRLRLPHGLYIASPSEHYSYVWLRDSVYMSWPYLTRSDDHYESAYARIFDLFRELEWKLDILGKEKPVWEWEYIHARYRAEDVSEIHDQSWGHVQHDMLGAILFGIGAGDQAGKRMLRDAKDKEILQKLVRYLANVQYWIDPDNGMWEEGRDIHASSVGACVAGLKAVQHMVEVPDPLIHSGLNTLLALFPRESADRRADLAQLSLIYPYRLFRGMMAEIIVEQVENKLLRERGVIRYEGDSYYSTKEEQFGRGLAPQAYYGTEAEWTFGLPWLALCRLEQGRRDKAEAYLRRTEELMLPGGELPELYFSGSDRPNPNTPLGWSSAMYILAKEALGREDRP
ncbi:glycoside hydrolase family 15 protein [Paenibacillus koleovorans]|uniref:glycoside hydrolase family 15 protein n=1 Tax=Paenibacillus koleovorans TaxID=121608 RepID=UPI000FDB80DA|nr:glycoside hydrolase family 15 protein [Paenibacillus koleovorans]